MKKPLAMLMLAAAVAAMSASPAYAGDAMICGTAPGPHACKTYKPVTVEATPELLAALNERFQDVEQDTAWVELGGGVKCPGCHVVWFETRLKNWACNFTFGTPQIPPAGKLPSIPVTIKNCWTRHA
jgi:hypothetical protein